MSTGYGVVRNVAQVRPGDAVVVFGVGGIGVNVLQTAGLSGAARILAVDVNPAKADVAARFGAHDTLIAEPTESGDVLAERVRTQIGVAVDVAVECSGAPAAYDVAIACTAWGGTTALVGIPRDGTRTSFAVDDLLRNRRIVGSLNGSVDLHRDFSAIRRARAQRRAAGSRCAGITRLAAPQHRRSSGRRAGGIGGPCRAHHRA